MEASWLDPSRPKLPPGALMAIADDLLADIYTIWLPLKDLCRLDSAVCAKWLRPDFLRLVSTKVLLFLREEIDMLDEKEKDEDEDAVRCLNLPELNWILKRGIHLASLRLFRMDGTEDAICEAVVSLIHKGIFDKLESIFIKQLFISDALLASILTRCAVSLKSFNASGHMIITSSWKHLRHCVGLREWIPGGNEPEADFLNILRGCPSLKKINLSLFGTHLTDVMVYSVSALRQIEYVSLAGCSNVSDMAIQRVVTACKNIKWISLWGTGVTDTTVKLMCSTNPHVKEVYLGQCDNITDASVFSIAETLRNLTHFSIAWNTSVTSHALETLAKKCCELEFLDVENCANMCDAVLHAASCKKLNFLSVHGCAITMAGLQDVMTKCRKLKIIDHA